MARGSTTAVEVGALLAPGGPRTAVDDDASMAALLSVADRHGLVPALWSSLLQAGVVHPTPASVRDHVADRMPGFGNGKLAAESAYLANVARVDDLVEQAVTVLGALDAAGVKAAPLKGIDAVLAGRYTDRGARTMTDIDVLVDNTEAAASVMAQLGYRPVPGVEPSAHQLPALVLAGRCGSVEVHRALSIERHGGVLDASAALANAGRTDDSPGWRLTRTDSVTHLIVHAQLHDESHLLWRLPLRALHETALAVANNEPVDWERVERSFAQAGRRGALKAHLALVSMLFDVASPLAVTPQAKVHVRLTLALDERPALHRRVEQVRYAPRSLSAERMHTLYGATGRWAVGRARLTHVGRAVRRAGGGESGAMQCEPPDTPPRRSPG
jgi:hypothetical protein